MSKYIDADVLIKDTIQEFINPKPFRDTIMRMINKAPSIDIVRCKECKWWIVTMDESRTDEDYLKCNMDKWTDADDFCSYGERSE